MAHADNIHQHKCKDVSDRTKTPVEPFYELLQSPERYSDKDFTPDTSSLYWQDMHEGAIVKEEDARWSRAYDVFGSSLTLFGKGISNDDIN